MLPQNNLHSDTRNRIDRMIRPEFRFFFTWLIGKPCFGETVRRKTVGEDLVSTFFILIFGVVVGYSAFTRDCVNLTAVPISWVCVLSSTRTLRLTIEHACSHNAVFSHRFWNNTLGEFISILTLTLPFREYQKNHTKVHHSNHILTPGDETYNFLFLNVGFRLGMKVDEAWKHLFKTVFSPTFHCRQLYSRIKSAFCSPYPTHNLISLAFWLSILCGVEITHSWQVFFWIWVLPLSVFFEVSSLLRQCVEHKFGNTPEEITSAIFCGEEPPVFNYSDSILVKVLGLTRWWMRVFFYHLPVRLLILTGDSPVHDYHHKRPGNDWVNAHIDRQAEIEAGVSYTDSWGLLEAIAKTFESLSTISPDYSATGKLEVKSQK
ncbi:MAG: fatty acid desaturase [Cyanobacteriota bacterium]|nr:fatty acid desaturase [Cyanobacteriota bacterium]